MQLRLQFLLHFILQQYLVLLFTLSLKFVPLDLRKVLLEHSYCVPVTLVLVTHMPGVVQIELACFLRVAVKAVLQVLRRGQS